METQETIEAEAQKTVAAILNLPRGNCLLCGRPSPELMGYFMPENSQEWGAAPGKSRTIVYWLCAHHVEGVGADEAASVAADILQTLAKGTAWESTHPVRTQ